MPTLDNNRELHGVIFLRRALYRNGVFRFKVLLPNAYNAVNTHPQITFSPPVFNPLIHPEVLDCEILGYLLVLIYSCVDGRFRLDAGRIDGAMESRKTFSVDSYDFLEKYILHEKFR